jgi:putative ABC transport system ATP-binding protein
MIKLRGITKYYSTGYVKTFVLRNITLDFAEGDFVTVMGPSGAGKSTLLHILGMLDTPSEGEYFFDERPVHRMTERQLTELHKHSIGFVFQSYHLIDDLTVTENLETPWTASPSSAKKTSFRTSSRAASSSGWPSPGPSSPGRSSSWPTSRRAT